MAVQTQQNVTARMVVLLRPSEKRRLQKLARKEQVSSAEIVRRSLAFYAELDDIAQSKELADMNASLDRTLASIQLARHSIQASLQDIAEQRSHPDYLTAQARLDEILNTAPNQKLRKSAPRRKAA